MRAPAYDVIATPLPPCGPGGVRHALPRDAGRAGAGPGPQRRIVCFTAGLPRGLKAQDYADLLHRHRRAAAERRALLAATADKD